MKKFLFSSFLLSLLLLMCVGCNFNSNKDQNSKQDQSQSSNQDQTKADDASQDDSDSPNAVASDFLKSLQQQNYASTKSSYSENLDNMANFRNQIEKISPGIANKLFSKLADFSYQIEESTIDPQDPNKATVLVTMDYYDVGTAFERSLLEYLKADIEMTYDGEKGDDIIKKADEIITDDIESSQKVTVDHIPIKLTKEDKKWQIDKISANSKLMNALTGNIMQTIDTLTEQLYKNQ